MFNPTISPHDPQTVLVSCDMTGSYITHDGGRSWRMFNLRGTVRFFVFDPRQPKTIYAATDGLWRSTDDGESWNLVWPLPAAIQVVRMNSDHADEQIIGTRQSDERNRGAGDRSGRLANIACRVESAMARTRPSSFPTTPVRTGMNRRACRKSRGISGAAGELSLARPVMAVLRYVKVVSLRIRLQRASPSLIFPEVSQRKARQYSMAYRSRVGSSPRMAARRGPRSNCRAAEPCCEP